MQQQLEQKELEESARIYQEIYEEDTELQELNDEKNKRSFENYIEYLGSDFSAH